MSAHVTKNIGMQKTPTKCMRTANWSMQVLKDVTNAD